jgi:hypothetical protein
MDHCKSRLKSNQIMPLEEAAKVHFENLKQQWEMVEPLKK